MSKLARYTAAIILSAAGATANAQIETYDFTVTPLGGPASAATGTFSYDCSSLGTLCATGGADVGPGLLSNLSFTFNGVHYDESTANTGSLALAAGGNLEYLAFGNDCPNGFCFLVQRTNDFLMTFFPTTPSAQFQYVSPDGGGWLGTVSVEKVSAPEIDTASSVTALTLLAGALLLIGERRSRPRDLKRWPSNH